VTRRLTSRDIAKHAGVSQTTVSLVLRGAAAGRVSPELQEHVRAVARDLGYLPSLSARSLRSGRAHMLGLVIPDVLDPFFGAVLRGAQAEASQRGYTAAMIEATSADVTAEAVAATEAGRFDGIVLHSPDRQELRRARAVADRLCVVDSGAPRGVAWIRYDLAHGVRQTIEHLESLGHRRFAHVGAESGKATFVERAKELRRVARDRLVATISAGFDFDADRAGLERFLRARRRATAIICDTDTLAAKVLRGAHAIGVAVPEELSVTAFNDTPLARALDLTTVSIPAGEAGRLGVTMLLDLIGGAMPARRTLPVLLVPRRSSASVT
jgi:LacI family transcriptional regulator, repressor for deo operon, udp, cdd, tsx, nupC, and nupG